MRKVKCPLCKGKGFLQIKKPKAKIECPICKGDKFIYEIEEDDVVWVEEFTGYLMVHKKGSLNPIIKYKEMTMREVTKHPKGYVFCAYCFGEYVIFRGVLIECE